MSWRIRAYAAVLALRHLGFGYAMIEDEGRLEGSSTFRFVFELAPAPVWAAMFFTIGVACVGGFLWPREWGIRLLVVASVGLSTAFAAGTLAAEIFEPPTASSIAVVAFLTFAAKDLIVASMAYVNPVEDLVTREQERARGRS